MDTELNDSPISEATPSEKGSGIKYGTGPKAEPARTAKDLPRVSNEKIMRHGHVV